MNRYYNHFGVGWHWPPHCSDINTSDYFCGNFLWIISTEIEFKTTSIMIRKVKYAVTESSDTDVSEADNAKFPYAYTQC